MCLPLFKVFKASKDSRQESILDLDWGCYFEDVELITGSCASSRSRTNSLLEATVSMRQLDSVVPLMVCLAKPTSASPCKSSNTY